jgi:hypothetical protein
VLVAGGGGDEVEVEQEACLDGCGWTGLCNDDPGPMRARAYVRGRRWRGLLWAVRHMWACVDG